MTTKKNHATEPKTGPSSEQVSEADQAAALESPAAGPPTVEELQKQLVEAQSQAAEFKDGWQRAVAEFQNFKRRGDAERAETYQLAVGNIIKRYLPVLDDLERALATRPPDLAWVEGIDLIYRKLQSILETEGVKRMEAEGAVFDPNFHEAISQEISDDQESGLIIEVVRNGYMLGEKVIRPAMVRVAK